MIRAGSSVTNAAKSISHGNANLKDMNSQIAAIKNVNINLTFTEKYTYYLQITIYRLHHL